MLAFFGYRQVKAQAKPNAQEVINSGFSQLVAELREQIVAAQKTANVADERSAEDRRRINNLEDHDRDVTSWHQRHLRGFDQPAVAILQQTAPDKAAELLPVLGEPFPVLKEN